MHGRTVVVTGGNSGVGLETAVALAGAGAQVVLGCRNAERAATAVTDIRRRSGNDAVVSHSLDLADLDSVRRFAEELSSLERIDVLVNNAGLVLDERRETAQGVEAVFGTNHLGHFLLTDLLTDQLRAAGAQRTASPARIVNVASDAHRFALRGMSWGDLDRHSHYRPMQVYGESKLANILHARALAARLEGTGVVAHSVHPGAVASNFAKDDDISGFFRTLVDIGNPLLLTPAKGARTSVHVATSAEAGASTGRFWSRSRQATPNRWARQRGAPERLWAISRRMIAAVS